MPQGIPKKTKQNKTKQTSLDRLENKFNRAGESASKSEAALEDRIYNEDKKTTTRLRGQS